MLANLVVAIFLLAGSSVAAEDDIDKVTFQLYTRPASEMPQQLDQALSVLDAGKRTYLIVHGFAGSSKAKSSLVLKDALLTSLACNVVLADWGPLASSQLGYEVVVKDTLVAGQAVARFVKRLMALPRADRHNLVLVGFSLGAHVVGVSANYLAPNRLSVIIALDAAGPLYHNRDLKERLDAGDADFVMAVHTDGQFFGLNSSIGHADFYPNGGNSPQPPCKHDEFKNACSHFFAPLLLAESVYNPKAFKATRCGSWLDFTSGKCQNQETTYMGLETPSTTRGEYFLRTNAAPPYGNGSGNNHVAMTPQDLEMDGGDLLTEEYDVAEEPGHQEVAPEVTTPKGGAVPAASAAISGVFLVLSAAAARLAR